MTEPVPAARSAVLCSAWATLADIPEEYQDRVTPETWERLLMQASDILWALSGRRWYGGGCTETVTLRSKPPQAGMNDWPYDASWGSCPCASYGSWLDGTWYAPVYARYPGMDGHFAPVAIKLPRERITEIVEVVVRGETLAPSAYRLTRSGWLERLDGPWNVCGDSTEVTYAFGEPPPEGGVQAAVALAVQLMLDLVGDNACRLPARVTSVTRQGISMTMLDPMDFMPNGKTGLYVVDLWLTSVNPHNRPQRGSMFSLDVPTTIKGATNGP